MKFSYLAVSLLVIGSPIYADTAAERLQDATSMFKEIMSVPDKAIPQDLLNKAHCVILIPGLKKGGFVVGAKYGKGFAVCRNKNGNGWGAPGGVTVEGGSFGFQIGAASNDVIMLVMSDRGMRRLLQDKFALGGDAQATGGPVGRSISAETDAQLAADILSYSRSQGLFAGAVLTAGTIRNNMDDNRELYGQPLTNKEILMTNRKAPKEAMPLISLLNQYSPHEAPNRPLETRAEHGVKAVVGKGDNNNADTSADRSSSADRTSNKTTTKTTKKKTTEETTDTTK